MEYASEMVIKASLMGMKITEVPITLSKDGRSRSPHLRPWRDGWRHLKFMILMSPQWLFIFPGLALSVLSFAFYVALFEGPLQIDEVVFDIHTLFYMQTGIIFGLMAVMLGLTLRIFGMREGLLRSDSILKFFLKNSILEMGGVLSLLLLGFGVYQGLYLIDVWRESGFGSLNLGMYLRLLSLSTLVISVGGIGLLTSLVIGFLSLPTRRQEL
jgi:hypothetical protein